MKVWVVNLRDGYGKSEIDIFENFNDAHSAGIKMISKLYEDENVFRTIHDYRGNKGEVLIVVDIEPEDFFPGETEVFIKQMEVK